MWDTIQKLEYRVRANIEGAQQELNMRLTDRMELPLLGLSGEKLYLTGVTALRKKAAELDALYEQLPAHRGMKDTILLDAWSSATIEGARTTVQRVRDHFENPKTKDDRMVVNTIMGSNYAYNHPITENNIRRLWEKIVDGVCENEELLILADTVHDLLPQPADVVFGNGMVVCVVAAHDGVDNHAVILGFGIFKMIPYPLYRCSCTLNGSRGPGIQKNGIFHTPVRWKLLIKCIQLCCLFPQRSYPSQIQLLTTQTQKRQFHAVSQSHIQFLLCTFDIGSHTIFQLLNGVPHRKYASFLGLMIFYQNDWIL